MEIQIKKFGKIGSANINLDGLSVIIGKNDSGKSTIGKCIYALKKSLIAYPSVYNVIHKLDVYTPLQEIIPRLKIYVNDYNKKELDEQIASLQNSIFDANYSFDDWFSNMNRIVKPWTNSINAIKYDDKNRQDLFIMKSKIDEIEKKFFVEDDLKKLESCMNKLFFNDIFCMNLNNSMHNNDISKVKLLTNNRIIVSFSVKNNIISVNKETDIPSFSDGFNDVVFIDTPLIIEDETINVKNSLYHNELRDKLFVDNKNNTNIYDNSEVLKLFNGIIKGEFIKNPNNKNRLSYKVSENASELNLKNIAMGSKVLGILYLLLKNGQININTLVILDEPENHLHPSWLIKLAEILCLMVSKGFRILLTTHNPDFVKALHYYSDKYHLNNSKSSHFYLCKEPKDNYTEIEEKTDKMNEIYDNLTSDISEIFFKSIQNQLKGIKNTDDK